MLARKKLVAGNWKMNGRKASLAEIEAIGQGATQLGDRIEIAVCPPATLASAAAATLAGGPVALGGQDCHAETAGAFTGDISAAMWADLGARYVIVGHSERRDAHRETDAQVAAKAAAAIRAGLIPIICVGESLSERDSGLTLEVVTRQLAGSVPESARDAQVVIAYEPVWAIGTGRTPTSDQVAEVHAALRDALRRRFGAPAHALRLLYGGSVKPDNAAGLMRLPDVDGALVGGASLKAADFLAIARACLD